MKSILFAWVLFAGAIFAADEVADRAAIENNIRALSLTPQQAGLFTADFDGQAELARLRKASVPVVPGTIPVSVENVPGVVLISKEPMGEAVWLPAGSVRLNRIAVRKIRFVTSDVAMVDAEGVLIVMKKVGTDWKIASLRVLAEK